MTTATTASILDTLGIWHDERVVRPGDATDAHVLVENPATGEPIAAVRLQSGEELEKTTAASVEAFRAWRRVPGPERGQLVRKIGEKYREYLEPLGELIALEMGKIRAEGIGEVQEVVDIADFAVGAQPPVARHHHAQRTR